MDNKLKIRESLKLKVENASDGQILSVFYPMKEDNFNNFEKPAILDFLCEEGMTPLPFEEDERKGLRYKIGRVIDEFVKRVPFNGERSCDYSFSVVFYDQSCYLTESHTNLFLNGFVDRAIRAKCLKKFRMVRDEDEAYVCTPENTYSVDYFAPCAERNYPLFCIYGCEFDWVKFHEYFEIVEKNFKPIKELHVVRFEDDTSKEVQG